MTFETEEARVDRMIRQATTARPRPGVELNDACYELTRSVMSALADDHEDPDARIDMMHAMAAVLFDNGRILVAPALTAAVGGIVEGKGAQQTSTDTVAAILRLIDPTVL